jgi:serine/threonine protein kinase
VAYEMFTGRKPFVHEDLMPLLQMHLLEDPVPPAHHRPGLPEGVQAAILRLLRKQPSERFPSARALGEALAALRDDSPA